MNIFFDDIQSLTLLRAVARGDNGLVLEPTTLTRPAHHGLTCFRTHLLGASKLLGYLRIPEEHNLGIVVPDEKSRVRACGVDCRVCSHMRGKVPLLHLVSNDSSASGALIPTDTDVYVMSPENVVLGMAARLMKRERAGSTSHLRARLMLLKLCLELCGTYVHDPFDPLEGRVTYGTSPILCAKALEEALLPIGRERGLSLAREVAPLVYDLSGSPQESFIGPSLFFATELGGLELANYVANEPLDLLPGERASIGYRTITPDFTLPSYRSVVEYKGSVHEEGDNPRIDHVRSLDYATLGYREFDFWYEDVRTRMDLMRSAARIVYAIAQYDGPVVQKRFVRLANSKTFVGRQETMFQVFRPWLR